MNILLLSHSRNDPDAGASRVYHLLREGLTSRGHHVETRHYEDFRLPRRRLLATGVEKLAMPQWIGWREAGRDFAGIDVVMAPSGMGAALFRRLRGRAERPLLVNHVHGLNLFDYQARLTEALARHMPYPWHKRVAEWPPIAWDEGGTRQADLTIVQNRRDLDYLRRHAAPCGIAMIAPALHPQILAASATARPPEERDPRTLIWFGSWRARKGAAALPPAFERVLEKVPDAALTIGGTGLLEQQVLSHFSARARARVRVLPRLPLADQIEALQRHAVFLFPSLSEGFGLALIEAMALGLAAVTTPTGVGADAVRDRDTGLIVTPGSALHLADAILEAIRDDASRVAMAQRGQALARRFTLARMAAEYETAFAAGLASARAASWKVREIAAEAAL
ncbi:MAG TPA: glycosyltransferase family 4 protein [Acetobacteraceae bacterium]|nr:glycosyltransferase family 4 protein [Acetobacteraceae bacterium]